MDFRCIVEHSLVAPVPWCPGGCCRGIVPVAAQVSLIHFSLPNYFVVAATILSVLFAGNIYLCINTLDNEWRR